jgi:hypothetical protein
MNKHKWDNICLFHNCVQTKKEWKCNSPMNAYYLQLFRFVYHLFHIFLAWNNLLGVRACFKLLPCSALLKLFVRGHDIHMQQDTITSDLISEHKIALAPLIMQHITHANSQSWKMKLTHNFFKTNFGDYLPRCIDPQLLLTKSSVPKQGIDSQGK